MEFQIVFFVATWALNLYLGNATNQPEFGEPDPLLASLAFDVKVFAAGFACEF